VLTRATTFTSELNSTDSTCTEVALSYPHRFLCLHSRSSCHSQLDGVVALPSHQQMRTSNSAADWPNQCEMAEPNDLPGYCCSVAVQVYLQPTITMTEAFGRPMDQYLPTHRLRLCKISGRLQTAPPSQQRSLRILSILLPTT
jgi:hypothetical protein